MLSECRTVCLSNKAPVLFIACLSAINVQLGSIVIPDKTIKTQERLSKLYKVTQQVVGSRAREFKSKLTGPDTIYLIPT